MQNQGPSGGILRQTLPGVLRSIPALAVELRSQEKHLIVQLAGNFFRQVSSCRRCQQKFWLVLKTPLKDMSHRGKWFGMQDLKIQTHHPNSGFFGDTWCCKPEHQRFFSGVSGKKTNSQDASRLGFWFWFKTLHCSFSNIDIFGRQIPKIPKHQQQKNWVESLSKKPASSKPCVRWNAFETPMAVLGWFKGSCVSTGSNMVERRYRYSFCRDSRNKRDTPSWNIEIGIADEIIFQAVSGFHLAEKKSIYWEFPSHPRLIIRGWITLISAWNPSIISLKSHSHLTKTTLIPMKPR